CPSMKQVYRLAEVNEFTVQKFTQVIGPVFEHSPWIAEATSPKRPFSNLVALHHALCETVRKARPDQQLALIRAHPDLVGRAALAGELTKASTAEQASAGLDKLSRDETHLFQQQNQAYQQKFGFPFVICARLNKKEAILEGFRKRLPNSHETE